MQNGFLLKVKGQGQYRKVPKFSDVRKLCCNLPKLQTKRQKLYRVFYQNDANVIANSEDLIKSDLSVRKLRVITVSNVGEHPFKPY